MHVLISADLTIYIACPINGAYTCGWADIGSLRAIHCFGFQIALQGSGGLTGRLPKPHAVDFPVIETVPGQASDRYLWLAR